MNGKYCPLRQQYCDGDMCALWNDDGNSCCFVSLAQNTATLKQLEYELYAIRRQLEDSL